MRAVRGGFGTAGFVVRLIVSRPVIDRGGTTAPHDRLGFALVGNAVGVTRRPVARLVERAHTGVIGHFAPLAAVDAAPDVTRATGGFYWFAVGGFGLIGMLFVP